MEYEGDILLLRRQDLIVEGDRWGIPSGRMERGETPVESMRREIREETGLEIPLNRISYFSKTYVRYPDEYDFIYHILHTRIDASPKVRIDLKEHKASRLISPQRALDLPMVRDTDSCIRLFYRI